MIQRLLILILKWTRPPFCPEFLLG
jgi:hypothetical protein